MSNQLQCHNCGGYKLESNLTEIDPKTGNKVGSSCFPLFFGVVILPVFFIGSWLVVGYQGENAYIIVLVWFVWLIWSSIATSQAKKRAYNLYNFHCNLCGYRWQWREGKPWPEVKVQPNLIAAGARRLEKEAIACKGCGNTIPEGYPYCPYCGGSR